MNCQHRLPSIVRMGQCMSSRTLLNKGWQSIAANSPIAITFAGISGRQSIATLAPKTTLSNRQLCSRSSLLSLSSSPSPSPPSYPSPSSSHSISSPFSSISRLNFCTVSQFTPSSTCRVCSSIVTHNQQLRVCNFSTNSSRKMAFTAQEFGSRNSADFRVFYKDTAGNVISPWHDIPLFADQANRIYNMVVEIPRWTNAKMEIATKEPMSPIKQDIKKGALRYVRNPFPHHGYIWNYGALPQTWEDPNHVDAGTNAKGDNDPIDVIEIGQKIAQRGEIFKVKVLGTLALIDEGETDWKVIAINVDDPLAKELNDIEDVQKHMPGFLAATVEWFKIYKIPDGKPANVFAFNGEAKNREFAEKVIDETHKFWKDLMAKPTNDSGLDLKNVSGGNGFSVKLDEANSFVANIKQSNELQDTKIEDQSAIDKVYYIRL